MATIFRISITTGIKFFYQPVKFPLTVFWKVCTRDERESRQLVRVLCRVWSPEVQGHRPARPHEIFTPERNELKQEYWSRLGNEGMSELKGNKEIANSGNQTDSLQRKCLADFATMTAHVDNKHNRLLLFQVCACSGAAGHTL